MKSILVHLNGTAADEPVLRSSLNVARLCASHIECLRVAADPQLLRMEAAQVDLGMSVAMGDMLAAFETYNAERGRDARSHFESFCETYEIGKKAGPEGIVATFREVIGDETSFLTAESRFHDLTILAGGPDRAGRLATDDLGSIVVSSGRPILLAPTGAPETTYKTIAVAWKSTPESARAITAALPLLRKAQHVHVLGASEENATATDCLECSEAITAYLRRHHVKANCHFVLPAGRSVPDAVLEAAHKHDTDLLVMGGYGHSRAREFILGGFTRRVLEGVRFPVLMVH